MKIGVVNMNDINDTLFCWSVQSLVTKFRDFDAEFFIPIFDDKHSNIDKIPLKLVDMVTHDRKFDLIIIFGAITLDSDWAFLISELEASQVFLVFGSLSEVNVINMTSKFEYALGASADVIVSHGLPPVLSLESYAYISPNRPGERDSAPGDEHRSITIFDLEESAEDKLYKVLRFSKDCLPIVVTRGKTRAKLMNMGVTTPIYGYSEVSIGNIVTKTGVLIDFSERLAGDIHRYFLTAAADAGIPLLVNPSLAQEIHPLDCYPLATESPNTFEVAKQLRDLKVAGTYPRHNWIDGITLLEQKIASLLPPKPPTVATLHQRSAPASSEPTIWMAPINGSGLGHVKRLVNITQEIKNKRVRFCSFGGAIDSVSGLGYDVVPLAKHVAGPGNRRVQLLNYRRLNSIIRENDCFVYDGGFPYDAVVSVIESKGLKNSVWIRRGLFRDDQDNREAFSREKYFSSVILPLEIFDELNEEGNAFGMEELRVSPIVDMGEYADDAFDLGFEIDPSKRLIVTMLGGGETREVEGEIFAICDELSHFDDIIHVVMDWPKSRYTETAWNFDNTHIIKTLRASYFIKRADLVISAAGYNSFNEITYSRKPVVYVPQSAPWLDDQEKRATAAQNRGVAVVCRPGDYLRLRAEVRNIVSGGASLIERFKANAEKLELPEPGNASAAQAIAGMVGAGMVGNEH